jgi:hypothetical protein
MRALNGAARPLFFQKQVKACLGQSFVITVQMWQPI